MDIVFVIGVAVPTVLAILAIFYLIRVIYVGNVRRNIIENQRYRSSVVLRQFGALPSFDKMVFQFWRWHWKLPSANDILRSMERREIASQAPPESLSPELFNDEVRAAVDPSMPTESENTEDSVDTLDRGIAMLLESLKTCIGEPTSTEAEPFTKKNIAPLKLKKPIKTTKSARTSL